MVTTDCMIICMPFVDVHILKVYEPTELVAGTIPIDRIPFMINTWIDTENLSAAKNQPVVRIDYGQTEKLTHLINAYEAEYGEYEKMKDNNINQLLQRDIIDLQEKLLIANVINIFFNCIEVKATGPSRRDDVYWNFLLSLYKNFREHRNVQYYANTSGMSLKYFSTLIKKISGLSPSVWIETVVISEAKSLLTDKMKSIKDVALLLNFPDSPTFTKYFIRLTGMTPKAYRQSLQ